MAVIMNTRRSGYAPNQCGRTMTVGELVKLLQQFDPEEKVYTGHDNRYTYGSVREMDIETFFEEEEEELEEDEED